MPCRMRRTKVPCPASIHLPGGLDVGSIIYLVGHVPCISTGFEINLQSGEESECDIPFHMKVDVGCRSVVLNSYERGWQEKEIPAFPTCYFPFRNGRRFSILIYIAFDYILVIVNGCLLAAFKHRLKYQDVRYLVLKERVVYYEAIVASRCLVPYIEKFQCGLKPYNAVRVKGCVNDDASRFAINFQCDLEGKNIGLHFNPMNLCNPKVLLNSYCGEWAVAEVVKPSFPFRPCQYFDIIFFLLKDCFQIYVNWQFFAKFAYRIPIENINFLNIEGDVTLMDVGDYDCLDNNFLKPLPEGLGDIEQIVVKGYFPEGDRFVVDLLNGQTDDSDKGFHISARRDQRTVVLNSQFGGCWGQEEIHCLPKGLKKIGPFSVIVMIREDYFDIYINGHKLASYKMRSALDLIKGVLVRGDAYFYDINFLKNMSNPAIERIPCQLSPGNWVSCIGVPKDKKGGNFAINLQIGEDSNYGTDIALHIYVTFDPNKVVCNSLINGQWGKGEICQSQFPFIKDEKFEALVLVKPEGFRIYVNGQYFVDYCNPCLPLKEVQHIMLCGDCDFVEPGCY